MVQSIAMAATKEAIVICLDVGREMHQSGSLETCVDAITMILQRKMFAELKDEVALVLFGTTNTANPLADGDQYGNITIARKLGLPDWPLLKYVQNDLVESDASADWLDALVVCMDLLVTSTAGKKFATKRVILLSVLGGDVCTDQLDAIGHGIKQAEVELNVIGPNLGEGSNDGGGDEDLPQVPGASAFPHGKPKSSQQIQGETIMRQLLEEVNGESYSFSQALPALSFFQTRMVRPAPWKVNLEISESCPIPIVGYLRVKESKPKKSWQVGYARDPDQKLDRKTEYHLNNDEQTEIEKDHTVEGHRYGSTLVPFSKIDKDLLSYKAKEKCLSVLGFASASDVKRHYYIGDSVHVFVAQSQETAVALSALIHALHETDSVAIVRYAYRAGTAPRMGFMSPHIKVDYECLLFSFLPYMEDIRRFTFASLDTNKKYIPTGEQLDVMDQLITTMDLSNANENEDGERDEALKPKLTFNPYIQRLYQCLQHRALNPDEPLPELLPLVAKYLQPCEEVEARCESTVKRMRNLFPLEELQTKKEVETGASVFQDQFKSENEPDAKKQRVGDDLTGGMAALSRLPITEVGTVSPVDDFRAILVQKSMKFSEACSMLQKRIVQLVVDSFGAQLYSKAIECLHALRDDSVKNSSPDSFNLFLKEFKTDMLKSRAWFWEMAVNERLTLISAVECTPSDVSQEEADAFLVKDTKEVVDTIPAVAEVEEADDLLDMM
ncbi:PREDICTED: X-ray repair cross-complementing protein 5-like [Priapulus caudatus]|uniref:ATP-dependent DNA helicase II subunit 2 n=1 Tax=Priapulus caudatus TaxID=37621 RepID=A0ABM1E8B7_PRICU|nr:PREDICTED: X-ray repair cross-complementing protein 5-like [Priapulus caudatus]